MREHLKDRVGMRGSFSATFQRPGIRRGDYEDQATMCFTEVRDEAGALVADHLWFVQGKHLADLQLKPGERISFTATVSIYYKRRVLDGGEFATWSKEDGPAFEPDYKLSHPAAIARLDNRGSSRPLPQFDSTAEAGHV